MENLNTQYNSLTMSSGQPVSISKLAVPRLVSQTNLLVSHNGNKTPFIHSDVHNIMKSKFYLRSKLTSLHQCPSDVLEHRRDCGGRRIPGSTCVTDDVDDTFVVALLGINSPSYAQAPSTNTTAANVKSII